MAVAMLAYRCDCSCRGRFWHPADPATGVLCIAGEKTRHRNRAHARGSCDPCHSATKGPTENGRLTLSFGMCASYEFALVSVAAAVTLSRWENRKCLLRDWRRRDTTLARTRRRASLGRTSSKREGISQRCEISLSGARPQSHNGFKVELAKRCIVHAFKQVTT